MKLHAKHILFLLFSFFFIGCSSIQTADDDSPEMRLSRIKSLHLACMVYSNKYDMALPDNLYDMKQKIEMEYNFDDLDLKKYELLIKGKMTTFSNPVCTIMCREKQSDKNGLYAVVYLDGHTEMIKAPNE